MEAMCGTGHLDRSLLESLPDAIYITDAGGHLRWCNAALERLTGYTRAELVGRSTSELYAPDAAPHLAERRRRAHRSDPVFPLLETRLVRKDDTDVPVEISLSPLQAEGGMLVTAAVPHVTGHGRRRTPRVNASPIVDRHGHRPAGVAAFDDITEAERLERELHTRMRQRAVIAELGQRALEGVELQALFEEAPALLAQAIAVEYVKVLELLPEGQGLRLRAGVGWREGVVGHTIVAAGTDSQAGYTLLSSTPAVVEDLRTETHFRGSPLLHEHGVVSGLSVIIAGQGRPFGVLGAHTTRRRTFTRDDVNFLPAVANVLAQAVMRQRAEAALRQHKRQIEAFARQLVEVQEAERRHLARDLHDELGQNLTGLHLLLGAAARESDRREKAILGEAQRLVSEVMGQVRHLARELCPAILDDLGLVSALQALFERYSTRTQLRVTFALTGPEPELTPAIRTAAYRIVQEALTNAARHAGVSSVTVRLWANWETMTLEIIDQGVGFDPAAALVAGGKNGLAGMRERARLVGGKLRVASQPGTGTQITATLPLADPSIEPPEP